MFIKPNFAYKHDIYLAEKFSEDRRSLVSRIIKEFVEESQTCKTDQIILLDVGDVVKETSDGLFLFSDEDL
jgi:hypothetical protein